MAPLLGVFVALGGLSYAPDGRINVLWLWLLWAGLPFMGSLIALIWLMFGGRRPWVLTWWRGTAYWQPTSLQRWHLAMLLQWAWALFALALMATFLLLLLFSDLAFGWSSTLALTTVHLTSFVHTIAFPWAGWWSAAVPNADVLDATRFVRIAPQSGNTELAGAWWPFLLANILAYNFLPRVLLGTYCFYRWKRLSLQAVAVQSTHDARPLHRSEQTLLEAPFGQWEDAFMLDWEQSLSAGFSAVVLGDQIWQVDLERWRAVEQIRPRRMVWHVLAGRSPVAELGDWIAKAQQVWQPEQALYVHGDSHAHSARHLASWQAFARQHGLTWLTKA
ncbi:DUF2868 domain-containing protein [Salinispirillum marinum]|uniref:DUF2868 domain-containing protein n=2 Tax=Saccharospirillaceae TaxID=255527 RepID=A0ABV8BAE5_9GAMM